MCPVRVGGRVAVDEALKPGRPFLRHPNIRGASQEHWARWGKEGEAVNEMGKEWGGDQQNGRRRGRRSTKWEKNGGSDQRNGKRRGRRSTEWEKKGAAINGMGK